MLETVLPFRDTSMLSLLALTSEQISCSLLAYQLAHIYSLFQKKIKEEIQSLKFRVVLSGEAFRPQEALDLRQTWGLQENAPE